MAENPNPNSQQRAVADKEDILQLDLQNLDAKPKHPFNQLPNLPPNLKPRTTVANEKLVSPAVTAVPNQSATNSAGMSSPARQMPAGSQSELIQKPPEDSEESEFNFHSKPGDKDPLGREITVVHYSSDGNYFIYQTGDHSLEIVAADGTLLSKSERGNEIYVKILDYLASNPELKRKYFKSLAFAVKTLYDGNTNIAVKSLEATYANLTRSLRRKAEVSYIGGALLLVIIAPIAYLITYRIGDLSELGIILFCAVVFSALGGFLSVTLNAKQLDVDVQNTFQTIMFYGAQRILLAMISGIFIYFLITSKVFLAFFEDINNINIYYVAFFLCGFSERLVPNLMLNFDDKGMFEVKMPSK